jgi:hypothetical protein
MSRSYSRNSSGSGASEFSYFITSDLSEGLIRKQLELKKMSSDAIDKMVEKVSATREKVRNLVRKLNRKLRKLYGDLDTVEFVKKGMKAAKKAKLDTAATKLFLRQAMYGESGALAEEKHKRSLSRMGKFLGYTYVTPVEEVQILNIDSKDFPALKELKARYDATQVFHTNVKNNMFNYRDCAPEALSGTYDRNRHNVNSHIHPLFAALFLPKIAYLERRMLLTNIGRMVLSRGQVYLKNSMFHLQHNVAPTELDAEMELAEDIASDPNSIEHFSDHSPLRNLLRRYECQVELYKTVLALRDGQYYSPSNSDSANSLVHVLNKQDWVFYDAIELNNIQDEGTLLRKLLAVFAVRPTLTVLSTYSQKYGIRQNSYLAKTKFKFIPIINVKLPIDVNSYGTVTNSRFSLRASLSQSDKIIEKGLIVPKKKQIVYSNGVLFFYVNRHNTTPTFTQLNVKINMRKIAIPAQSNAPTGRYNRTHVDFDDSLPVGKDMFDLRSVVYYRRKPLNGMDIYTGCSSAVVHRDDSGNTSYFQYSPLDASIMFPDTSMPAGQAQYRSNNPVTYIPEYDPRAQGVGFRSEAQERGTIFVYAKHE